MDDWSVDEGVDYILIPCSQLLFCVFRFFVMKTSSEDDIHRSIKYNVWSGADHGNRRLDAVWREGTRTNKPITSSNGKE